MDLTVVFFDVHVTMHRAKFLIIKPTRCTSFSNLCSEWNSTCCGQFPCPSSGVFHCTHSNGICHTGLLTACDKDQNGTPWSSILILPKIPTVYTNFRPPAVYTGSRQSASNTSLRESNKILFCILGDIFADDSTRSNRREITWSVWNSLFFSLLNGILSV